MTHGLIEASIAGNDDALPLIRGHLTWMEYSDQLPEYLPPDGGPDTFSADYQKVWGTPNRFVEYAGNPSVSVGGGSSDGHRVYLIYQGLIHQTRMATSANGTKRDVQLFEELMKEDWWLEQLIARNTSAIWLRHWFPHSASPHVCTRSSVDSLADPLASRDRLRGDRVRGVSGPVRSHWEPHLPGRHARRARHVPAAL